MTLSSLLAAALICAVIQSASSEEASVECDLTPYRGKRVGLLHFNTESPTVQQSENLDDVWTSRDQLSLSHLSDAYWETYARLHGYEFIRVHLASKVIGPYVNWNVIKAHLVVKFLKHFDYLVLLDTDVVINVLEQSIICLFERWNFTAGGASVLAALDPNQPKNIAADVKGVEGVWQNTGFMVFKGTARGREIAAKWDDEILAHREAWETWPREQLIWHKYVRPLLEPGENIVLACDEANGYGWFSSKNRGGDQCKGRFITHAWLAKKRLREILVNRLLHVYAAQAYQQMRVEPIADDDMRPLREDRKLRLRPRR